MKLRKIEPNLYEYDWENKNERYAVVYGNEHIIAMFCSYYWANNFVGSSSISQPKLQIMEVIDEH